MWSTASRGMWSDPVEYSCSAIVVLMLLAQEIGRRKINPIILATCGLDLFRASYKCGPHHRN